MLNIVTCFRGAALGLFASLLVCCQVLSDDLSLQQAVDQALRNNPTITANDYFAQAARESARGAKALANPELIVAPSIVGDAGSDSAVLFSQPLEINGSRKVRGEIASFEANVASSNAIATRRDIVLKVTQLYWDMAKNQQFVQLNEENINYLVSLDNAVQKQVDVGSVPGSQLIKTQVELARARQELIQVRLELTSSQSALASAMNCPPNSDFTAADPLVFSEMAIDKSKLFAQSISKRPELAAAELQQAVAQRQIKAAKLQRMPDLAIQARRESFDNESDGGVAIAITLPIFDWGSTKAERRRAESAACSKAKELEAVRNGIALEVEQAIQAVESTSLVICGYNAGIIAKTEQLAAMAQKGFEKGATSYLEVLEAQRTLRSIRVEYASALANHAKAVAQLQWASGSELVCTEVRK